MGARCRFEGVAVEGAMVPVDEHGPTVVVRLT